MFKPVVFFIPATLFCCNSYAQQTPKDIIRGKITDAVTGHELPFAHVWNESKRRITISDHTGYFSIKADAADTIVISSLGYLGDYYILSDDDISNGIEIHLQPRIYEIDEVKIISLGPFSKFKHDFVNLKLPETETDILRNNLHEISKQIGEEAKYELAMKKAAEGGNLLAMPILSPEDIQRIKLKKIVGEENIQKSIDRKYNRQIVADLTGLNDFDLDDFILFCAFDKNYLYKTNQYDILVRMLEKFEEFKKLKKCGSLEIFPEFCSL
jgi:hypothetical protein